MINGILRKFFFSGKDSTSRDVAKKRLKIALVYDKLDVSDDIMENLQRDIIKVISRYFEIDIKAAILEVERTDDELSALTFNTPIIRAKSQPMHAAN